MALFTFTQAAAADYQTAFSGNVSKSDSDVSFDFVDVGFSVGRYLEPVETDSNPIAFSRFLSKQPSFSFGVNKGKLDAGNHDDDLTAYHVGARLVGYGDLILGLGLRRQSRESGDSFFPDLDVDDASLSVGKYIADNVTLGLGYRDVKRKQQSRLFTQTDNYDEISLGVNAVLSVQESRFIALEGAVGSTEPYGEDALELGVGGTYYFHRMLGLGLGVYYTDGDGVEFKRYSIGASHYFTENVAVQFSLGRQSVTNQSLISEFDSVGLGVIFLM